VRGWLRLYSTSVRLGLSHLVRRGYLREAVIRVVVPLEPSRYLELPWAARGLGARPGDRVLDLASPKLLAVVLAGQGVDVTSVDQFPAEIETWRRLAGGRPNLRFEVADGRELPYEDASFDAAYSVSVLEHVADEGDAEALRELARVVRPGGRVVVTLPFAETAWDEFRAGALYADGGESRGRSFFQRWYDRPRVDALVVAVPELSLVSQEIVRLQPNLNSAYTRTFPLLLPLGPLFGLLARERRGSGGDVVRLAFTR
jgi:SAM-dependent methyltransferase